MLIRSELDDRCATAFEAMEKKDDITVLTGRINDQPHLHGILDRLISLGLELSVCSVCRKSHETTREGCRR